MTNPPHLASTRSQQFGSENRPPYFKWGLSSGDFVILDVKKIKNFTNGDPPKEPQEHPQSRNFKFPP
jgi:hypothetical protein